MSYCRFGGKEDSFWYIYWSCSSAKSRNRQLVHVVGATSSYYFSYRELLDNFNKCLIKVAIGESRTCVPRPNAKDFEDLVIHLGHFVFDVHDIIGWWENFLGILHDFWWNIWRR